MNYKTELSNIESSSIINNLTKNSVNYILYNIFCETKINFIVHIVDNNFELELASKEIQFYDDNIEIIKFPEWNTMPYDVNSPQLKIQSDRMEAIYKLMNFNSSSKKKTLFLISKNAVMQRIIGQDDYKFLNFYINQQISADEIKNILESNCYENSETSINLGNFSINNNVVDLVTFNNQAYRIFLKNNTIDEIKSFNPETQITFGNHEKILVLPIREVIFSKQNIQNFKQNYRNAFGISADNDIMYENISNGVMYNGFENWLPLFYNNNLESIFSYIPKNSAITYDLKFISEIETMSDLIAKYYELRANELKHEKNKLMYNPIKPKLLYLDYNELKANISNYLNIIFNSDDADTSHLVNFKNIKINFIKTPNFFKESKEVFKSLQKYLNENNTINS